MRCPGCGFLNPEEAQRCSECGAVLGDDDPIPSPPEAEEVEALRRELAAAQEAVRHLRRYVPSIVAEGVLYDQERLRDERREVAVLFADAVDFTRLAASLDAEAVFVLINDLLARLVACVHNYDGLVDKFTGDGLMAVFGAPVAHENDAELAVRAALDMQRAAEEFEPIARAQLGAPLRIRIGIHCGPVVAGILGAEEQAAYTVIGETVNLAARLESLARPSRILVSARTYQQVQGLFNFQAMGMTQIKGVPQPLAVYEVIGSRSEPLPTRGVAGVTAILLGRDAELQQLCDLLSAFLNDGRGRLVTIRGEAGMGKTRLVTEWLSTITTGRVAIWHGRGLPYAQGVGYGVFRSLLRDARLSYALDAEWDVHVPPDLRPFLRRMAGLLGSEEQELLYGLEPERVKHLTILALREWVLGEARRRPVVLVLEDFHWADDLSCEALRALVNVVSEAPVLLCVTARPHPEVSLGLTIPQAEDAAQSLTLSLELGALSPEQSRVLLGHLVNLNTLPEHLVETILNRAEGNPFYVEEFVRMLIEKEVLRLGDGQWQVASTADLQTLDISATLRGLMMARVDRLPESLRHVLRAAAVIGLQFEARLLAEVERRLHGVADVLPLLERLTDLGLLVERPQAGEQVYAFRHVLTQETIYDSLLRSQRPKLHRAVAECVEQLYANDLRSQAEVLALHYDRAYMRAKAMQYALLAGERARERFANREAIEYYSRALQLSQHLSGCGAERWQAAIGLGEVLQHIGEYDEAIACYQAALEEWRDASPQTRAWTMLRLGQVWDKRGELEEAEGWLRQGLAQLSQASAKLPEIRAQLYAELGWLSLRRGDLATARDWLGQGLDLVGSTRHYDVLASIFDRLGAVHHQRGEWNEAEECIRRALQHRQQMGDIVGYARSLNSLAQVKWAGGDWDGALDDYRRAADLYEHVDEVEGLVRTYTDMGMLYTDRGKWNEAEEYLRRGLAVARRVAQTHELAQVHVRLGRLYLLQGRWDEVSQHLSAAIPLCMETGPHARTTLSEAYYLQGVLCMEQEQIEAAQEWAERFPRLLQEAGEADGGDSVEWGRYSQLMGRIALAKGDLEEARRHLKRGVAIFQGRGAKLDAGRAIYWGGLVSLAQRKPEAAREELERARQMFAQLGATVDLQQAEQQLARIEEPPIRKGWQKLLHRD